MDELIITLRVIVIITSCFLIGFKFALRPIYKKLENMYSFYGRVGIIVSIFVVQWLRLLGYRGNVTSIIFLSIAAPSITLALYGLANYWKKNYGKHT
jgi:hypothetical protein